MMRLISILLFLVFYGQASFCQNYEVQKLGIDQGLSNNFVVSVAQDRNGYIWFATESGLNRFDGQKFTVFKKRIDESGISGNSLNKVYADEQDDFVYVATQRDGLNRINSKTGEIKQFKNNPKDVQSLITNDITDISAAKNGGLWVSTFYQGVEHFDRAGEVFTHLNKATLPTLASDLVWTVREDNNKNLFIGHVDAGLSIVSLNSKEVKNFRHSQNDPNSLPSDEVRALFIDDKNNVWIGTDNGLALYQRDRGSFVVFKHQPGNPESLPSNRVFSITQLKNGKLCVGTEKGGLSFIDINKQLFSRPEEIAMENVLYTDDRYGLSNSTVRNVLQDSFGNIWLGTYGGGINFIGHRGSYFKVWTYSPVQTKPIVLNNPVAWGLTFDDFGRPWIGTDGGGINVFDANRRVKILNTANGLLKSDAVIAAMRDKAGNMWFGTYQGDIQVFDRDGKNKVNLTLPERSSDIRTIYQNKAGEVWIGTTDGIFAYDPNNKEQKLRKVISPQRSFILVRAIAQDRSGNYYIGLYGQGVVILDKNLNVIAKHETETGLPSSIINHLYEDHNGRVWCATAEGIVRFDDPKTIVAITDSQQSEQPDVRAVMEDNTYNIWYSTASGITKYIPRNNSFFHYDYHFGLPNSDFMRGSVMKDAKGLLYFGSQEGLCFFNPLNVPTDLALPETKITSFKVLSGNGNADFSEIEILSKDKISLAYNRNTLDISFNIMDYAISPLVKYSYMIEGLDDSWYPVEGNNIVFRNIPPGKYILKIKSRVLNQEWSENILTQVIEIRAPWWWSWWTKSLYVIMLAFIIWYLLRFYKRKVDLENTLLLETVNHQHEQGLHKERIRFFTNITHELKTPLTLILGPLEDMKQEKELSSTLQTKIGVVHKSSSQLMGLVTQLLEFQKIEDHNRQLIIRHADIIQSIEDIAIKYKEYSLNREVDFELISNEDAVYMKYDKEVLGTILENLLSNAFKYTDKGKITLVVSKIISENKAVLEITVKDTGRGIPLMEQEKIFDRYYQVAKNNNVSGTGIGLALVHSLVKLHQAEILVKSSVGVGSSFTVQFQLEHPYPEAIHDSYSSADHMAIKEIEISKEGQPIILVIEDDHDILAYIRDVLAAKYQVVCARNGQLGLKEAFKHIPDLIISDVMMPEMDGFEMSKLLKGDLRTSHIPIILLTAKDSTEDRKLGYAVGVDSYLVKPFSTTLLESRILNLLESRKKLASLFKNNETILDADAAYQSSISTIDSVFLEKVESIISSNILSDKIDVEFLAEKLNMSHSTLYRKIKGLTEMTVNEFIRKVKIEFAAKLLDTGEHSITEVACMVGINSLAYFKQCFKDQFKMTVTDYIKRVKIANKDDDLIP